MYGQCVAESNSLISHCFRKRVFTLNNIPLSKQIAYLQLTLERIQDEACEYRKKCMAAGEFIEDKLVLKRKIDSLKSETKKTELMIRGRAEEEET